jgi:hypothetical protein
MAQPDATAILKRLPIAVGALASVLLLVNRILTPALTDSQARSDALGIILCAVLVLTGFLWQQIQPQPPEAVTLKGEEGFELDSSLPPAVQAELAWASRLLLTNTVTKSIVLYYQGRVLLRRGILGPNRLDQPGPILQRVLQTQKPIYLVSLKLYPGRVEFSYLPENTQGIICQPVGEEGVMVLGANIPRSYTKQDEAWITALAEKISVSLNPDLATTASATPPASSP